MNLFELRQTVESSIPWYAPLIPALVALMFLMWHAWYVRRK